MGQEVELPQVEPRQIASQELAPVSSLAAAPPIAIEPRPRGREYSRPAEPASEALSRPEHNSPGACRVCRVAGESETKSTCAPKEGVQESEREDKLAGTRFRDAGAYPTPFAAEEPVSTDRQSRPGDMLRVSLKSEPDAQFGKYPSFARIL